MSSGGILGRYDKLECKAPIAGNVSGSQRYNAFTWVETEHYYGELSSPNNYG